MIRSIDIKRRYDFDVAVIGGGTAGVFAAICAAKIGARTVLIEKNSRLGGTVTAAGVNYPGLFHAWGKQIIGGPCWNALERTAELGGAVLPQITYKPKRHWMEQVRVNKLIYTKVINDLCREAGVSVMTDAMLSHAEENDSGVSLLVTDKAGLCEINAGTAIDSTGDATLVSMLGYECQKSDVQQPATPDNHISGYELEKVDLDELRSRWTECELSRKVTFERLKYYLEFHKLDCHVDCVDADSPCGRAALEVRAVDELYEYCRFLRTVKGLENLTVDSMADETGVRESVRIFGEHIVTADEYVRGEHYADSVCYAFYPVDLHVEKGIEQTFLADGVVPRIPYRALIPRGARRVLCAGRTVSSDTYANSALRVQAPCMAMGQVAGVAAALAADAGVGIKEIDFERLCDSLRSLGAIVPTME
jgi:hypothetical protein